MPGEKIVSAWCVEYHEIGALTELRCLLFQCLEAIADEDPKRGAGKFNTAALLRFHAVLEVAVEGALAGIEIEGGHFRALVSKSDGDVHRGRRLSGAALFIGEDDTMRGS